MLVVDHCRFRWVDLILSSRALPLLARLNLDNPRRASYNSILEALFSGAISVNCCVGCGFGRSQLLSGDESWILGLQ